MTVARATMAIGLLVTLLAMASAVASAPSTTPALATRTSPAPARSGTELPRGGRKVFPEYQLVGFCGTPGAPALGRLTGDLTEPTKTLLSYADRYQRLTNRKVLPVFELIAVVGQASPGDDGMWRRRMPDSVVDKYLRAAREAKALLLLDLQPGRSDFLTEARHFERYLRAPDVGLALDPEWDVHGKQKMGETFGQTSGETIDAVAAYLSEIVGAGDLPEKVLVYHRVTGGVVQDASAVVARQGVAIVQSVDGFGSKAAKIKTYGYLVAKKPKAAHSGIKLFFEEDTRSGGLLMTPEEVLGLRPKPEFVMYE